MLPRNIPGQPPVLLRRKIWDFATLSLHVLANGCFPVSRWISACAVRSCLCGNRRCLNGCCAVVEEWRPVPGFPNYEVSSEGRVRSLDCQVWGGPRAGFYIKSGRILRPGVGSHGYPTIMLGRKGGTRTVHSLVAEAFIGPRPEGQEVRHKDGNRGNPKLENLHYGTRGDNVRDAIAHGTRDCTAIARKIRTSRLTRDPDTYSRSAAKGRATEIARYGPAAREKIARKTVETKNELYGLEWGALGFAGIAYSKGGAR